MTALPLSIGIIHFTGIGGIGMSGIAEILHELGYQVQGSDLSENANVARLRSRGIKVKTPQRADNLKDVSIVVISTAIKDDNIELIEARRQFLPVVHRSEMLGELMRLRWSVAVAGTHGKTTTTSLVATLFDSACLDPTVVNGGIISSWGSNARLGAGDWMVVEADESDGSFSRLKPTVAIVTNIDPEHLDHHGSFENLEQAFANFISSIPFYGFATLCIDHPAVQRLLPTISDRRVITYGLSTNADIRAANLRHENDRMIFDVLISDRLGMNTSRIEDVIFPMLGEHNVQNCLAALSVCLEMGLDIDLIRSGLAQFKGVGRRFDIKGEAGGITVIDDYGHHPVEIKAALDAGRMYCGENKLIAVVQPHRYSRLRDLFSDFCACFNEADHVIVADVYAAGEAPLEGFEKDQLAEGLRAYGHRSAHVLDAPEDLAKTILPYAESGDLVMCLGAGSITQWAADLPANLKRLQSGDLTSEQAEGS
ncbi:UDP-N-acetylmuramate--alanine ligase [SAR116 cluster alpha proteobacterium HIMB100]|nr:UDP-N-acetylmuramate--alanine ligase [SAR116 cluster alpha proteobacterium HIMB100]